jgi:hypothetical protein
MIVVFHSLPVSVCSGTGNMSSFENEILQDKSFLYEVRDKNTAIETLSRRCRKIMRRRLDVIIIIIIIYCNWVFTR